MAFGTGILCMGLLLKVNCIYQRYRCRGTGRCPGLLMVVAVKAKPINFLSRPGVLQTRLKMTNHAVLVFGCKKGQFGFLLVADVALFFQGPIGIKRFQPILRRKLFMRRVTFDAVFIALIVNNFLGTV